MSHLCPQGVTTVIEDGRQSDAMDHYDSAMQTKSCSADITDILTAKCSADLQFSVAAFVKRQIQLLARIFLMNVVVNCNVSVVKSQDCRKLWLVGFRPNRNSKQSSELTAKTRKHWVEREMY